MTENALKRIDQIAMKAAAFLAIVALLARVVAVPAMAEAHSGSLPFCGGGKITWVVIDGERNSEGSNTADPCPYMGLPVAPASAPPEVSLPKSVWFQTLPLFGAAPQHNPAPILTTRSRAPPQGF